jgi:hypothetical protein
MDTDFNTSKQTGLSSNIRKSICRAQDLCKSEFIRGSFLLLSAVMLTGCGYRFGGMHPVGIESVAMEPVINATGEPAIEIQVTHALRERIQYDGRVKLVNKPENADGIIEVRLTQYDLTPIAYRSDLRTTPELYRMRITGEAQLKKAGTDEVIAKSKTFGEATFQFEFDLTTSKRDALPTAAAEIAKFMADDLLEQW